MFKTDALEYWVARSSRAMTISLSVDAVF